MEKLTFEKMYEIFDKCESLTGDECDDCPLSMPVDSKCDSACSYINALEEAIANYNFNLDMMESL